MNIRLSPDSIAALQKFRSLVVNLFPPNWQYLEGEIPWEEVKIILNHAKSRDKEVNFLLESLRGHLLGDLRKHLFPNDFVFTEPPVVASRLNKLKFAFLLIAGTIFAIAEGFDGIASILGLFAHIPGWGIFLAGAAFSILGVIIFYGFDLVEIAKNLGVKFKDAPKLMNAICLQAEEVETLVSLLRIHALEGSSQDLEVWHDIKMVLIVRHEQLQKVTEEYRQVVKRPVLQIAKYGMAFFSGVLFFGGGFFAGQSFALYLGGMFVSGLSSTFWPIILVAAVVGIFAFGVYWFVERPGLDSLIGRICGVDGEQLDSLESKVKKIESDLGRLQITMDDALARKIVLADCRALDTEEALARQGLIMEAMDERFSFFHPPPWQKKVIEGDEVSYMPLPVS